MEHGAVASTEYTYLVTELMLATPIKQRKAQNIELE